jgi:aldehyde dehydrogenase (NAD+)
MPLEKESIQEIRRIFEKQKSNRISLANTTATERKAKLRKLLNEILSKQEKICDAVYKDLRKSKEETKLTEIFAVTTELKHAIRNVNKWMRPKRVSTPLSLFGSSGRVMYESIGQSLIIAPWNYPFQLVMGPLCSAIAAGNAVIIKPSEKSPNTSQLLKEIIEGIFPEEEAKVFLGEADVSKELTSLPFNHIFFTGSPEVGKLVMKAASENLTKVTLELGGKSPAIINYDADIKTSAQRIAWGKFMNAGQTCVAPDYLLVHQSIKEKLVGELISSVKTLYGENENLKRENNYCRMINKDHLNSVKDILDDAVAKGGRIIYGGEINEDDNLVSPTLIENISSDSKLMEKEIFGPVLPVITFKNQDEIFDITEKNPNPLALYVFSKNKSFIKSILKKIPAGSSAVNEAVLQFANYNLPFGGINHSGIGKSHGYYGFKTFSNEKSVLKQRKYSTMTLLYPPYNKFKNMLINLTIKYF